MTEPLDRYMDDYGRSLHERVGAKSPRRRARLLPFAVAAGAASVVVGVLVLAGMFSARPVDAVAAARAALSPDGEDLVYLRITSTADASAGVNLPQPRRRMTEQWIATDPPRWRMVETVAPSGQAVRQEYSFGGGERSSYDPQRRRLRIREGLSEEGLAARPPGPFGDDPETTLSALLRSSRVTDLGEVRARGRAVRRLRVVRPSGDNGRARTVLTYDVDPQVFTPIAGEVRRTLTTSAGDIEFIVRFVVDEYRRIPLGPRTAGLLEIDPRPGPEVTRVTADEAAAEQRRLGVRPRRER